MLFLFILVIKRSEFEPANTEEWTTMPTFVVVLAALVVESVRDLVANDPADAAVVHVGGPVSVEEYALHIKHFIR